MKNLLTTTMLVTGLMVAGQVQAVGSDAKMEDLQDTATATTATAPQAHGVAQDEEEILRIFSEGKLVYKPNPNSDEDRIELEIPEGGTFDLSKCGKAADHFTITTDPSVFFAIEEREPKQNILIAPHFLIKQCISTSASEFAFIEEDLDSTKNSVGIFWRWSAWRESRSSWISYLLSSPLSEISSQSLGENYRRAHHHQPGPKTSEGYKRTSFLPETLPDHFMFVF